MVTAGPTLERISKESTNSAMIPKMRQGSSFVKATGCASCAANLEPAVASLQAAMRRHAWRTTKYGWPLNRVSSPGSNMALPDFSGIRK